MSNTSTGGPGGSGGAPNYPGVSVGPVGTPNPFSQKKTITKATQKSVANNTKPITQITNIATDLYDPGYTNYATAFLSLGLTQTQFAALQKQAGQRTGHGELGGALGTSIGTDVLPLPFNPNELVFSYVLNKQSFDTYGGRVTQLLSVKIDSMTLQLDAGSRSNLVAFFNALKMYQTYQIEHQLPMKFTIPSNGSELANKMLTTTGLTFYVWLRSIDVGWDVKTTSNAFSLAFEVEDTSYEAYADSSSAANGYAAVTKFIGSIGGLFNITKGGIGYSAFLAGMPSLPGIPGTGSATVADLNAAGVATASGYNAAVIQSTGLGNGQPYTF